MGSGRVACLSRKGFVRLFSVSHNAVLYEALLLVLALALVPESPALVTARLHATSYVWLNSVLHHFKMRSRDSAQGFFVCY